ncbi:hypothetical protein BKN37_13555 [Mycobacterium talmoniae]|uniref:Uncharacterized protein n=2 Tax=Mycobacterium talmoniae TaxID=1858794 RepID=A0A1S1NKI5_9MYCO|nr:hypothetical protein BKN37_13555 [Mycobacterium talmoniae]
MIATAIADRQRPADIIIDHHPRAPVTVVIDPPDGIAYDAPRPQPDLPDSSYLPHSGPRGDVPSSCTVGREGGPRP